MDSIRNKRQIYWLVIVWFLWLIFVWYWIITTSSNNWTIEEETISNTNDILSNIDSLPNICNNTLSLLNCMISSPQLSWDKEGINQYYQKLMSERNIITDKNILQSECTQQYKYIQSLQETWYQQIIQSCL
jgi:hypothetical protein